MPLDVEDDSRFYPSEKVVKEILAWDNDPGKMELPPEVKAVVEKMKAAGFSDTDIQMMVKDKLPKDEYPERNQTYHYLPYRFDSNLEKEYFANGLIPLMKDKQLEYYFNGDDTLQSSRFAAIAGWASTGSMMDFIIPTSWCSAVMLRAGSTAFAS